MCFRRFGEADFVDALGQSAVGEERHDVCGRGVCGGGVGLEVGGLLVGTPEPGSRSEEALTYQVTTLRPAPGLTPEDFVAANADINEYLRGRPGFQWRRIVVRDDGTVLDIVAYDSIEHARSGAAGITGEMGGSPVHEAIDHATVDWQLTTVLQHVEP